MCCAGVANSPLPAVRRVTEDHPAAVRIQFRLPSGRIARRFYGDELVDTLYEFVRGAFPASQTRNFELFHAFPAHALRDDLGRTLVEANLTGDVLSLRWAD